MGETLKKEDYILYILNHLEPEKSDYWCLNKIAFLVEFAYLFFTEKELSDANYAAIDHGPVIDGYKKILDTMEKRGLVKIDGHKIRLVDSRKIRIPEDTENIVAPFLKRYSQMTQGELKALTHATDSYKMTTRNELVMGNIINKKLAQLETFFDDRVEEGGGEDETILVDIDRKKLVKL